MMDGFLGIGRGKLRAVIEAAKKESGLGLGEMTVLSQQNDPYRLDTKAGHREGQWFYDQVQRFRPSGQIHLRGLHYRISSAGDVLKPNGKPYQNSQGDWAWLQEKASKAARWLGYVQFGRIIDERNDPPALYVPDDEPLEAQPSPGLRVGIPEPDEAIPGFDCAGFVARQPYRIVLFGEKSSLAEVLQPVAEMVGGEMILPTGEASETMISELACGSRQPPNRRVLLLRLRPQRPADASIRLAKTTGS